MKKRIILGIDPGTRITGYAVGAITAGKLSLIDYGYISFPATKPLPARVGEFHATLSEIIVEHHVTEIALETPFLGKNTQTFLKLGYLRGILYLLAHAHGATLHEFAPRSVKLAVTGSGGAEKEQVARALKALFPQLAHLPLSCRADVTDAIAITLCAAWKNERLK